MFDQLKFSVPEILSLIGLTQCVYVLVYMAFRSGNLKKSLLPLLYFCVLGGAFFTDFARGFIQDTTSYYPIIQWFLWFMGPPLSVLLIVQIVQINKLPNVGHFWVLFLTPLAYVFGVFMSVQDSECIFPSNCAVLQEWLVIGGLVAGAISLSAIWMQRNLLENLYREKIGKERYWLVLTLVVANLLFLGLMLFSVGTDFSDQNIVLARTFAGLAFVYLAGTSLFRIYPQALDINTDKLQASLTPEELSVARRIEKLMDMDKIYHEPSYSRTDLARELGVGETVLSRIINVYFEKSFPQLLNERRVADAKRLLVETNASMKTVAEEVGFNSLATFNRVFRDMTDVTPSAYRKASSLS